MANFVNAERDAADLAKLVNEDVEVTTRYGDNPKKSYPKLIKEIQDGADNKINSLADNFNLTPAFDFADGFTIQTRNQAGKDASGNYWIYNGVLPFEVTAGTAPSEPDYKKVTFSEAQNVTLSTGQSVQGFADSFALKIFQSPTDGGLTEIQTRTVDGGEVYEVRKTSDDSLATIYSDAAGAIEIVQNGTSNVSDSAGVVEFYIADGDYYVEVDEVRSSFGTLTSSNVSNANGGSVQDFIDSMSSTVSGLPSLSPPVGSSVTIRNRAGAEFEVVTGGTPNGFNVLDAGNGNTAVYKIEESNIIVEHCGMIPNDQSSRTVNNQCFEILKNLDCSTLTFTSDEYYFSTGLMMQTNTSNKALVGRKGNSPIKLYFNGVIDRNIPKARLDTLSASADLSPENEPNETNTAICYGTISSQVGRAQFENIRIVNDSSEDTYTDKSKRVGTGFFVNSGWLDYDRVITDGWHVGSYELSFVTNRSQCEHIGFNIGFIYISGTSSTLSAMVANGTNYNTNTATFEVTYTTSERNELQGSGMVFGPLYYSNFSGLAVDKMQTGYVVLGNENSYRTHLNFNGCGCEFVGEDFYIDAPNTSVLLNGGQDWGVSKVENADTIYIKNRRFPYNMNANLSASKVIQDSQSFKLQNPIELDGQESCLPINFGYNGLNYQRVKVDVNFKYWRITGRLEVNELIMRIKTNLNGSVSGSLNINYLNGNDATEFSNSFGVVRVNTLTQAGTARKQSYIDPALNVTAVSSSDYYEIQKPALTSGSLISVDVDIIIKTGFSVDFTKKSTRPDFVTFLGLDF